MTVGDWIALFGLVITILTGIFGSTWYMSAKLEKIKVTGELTGKTLDTHVVDDNGR